MNKCRYKSCSLDPLPTALLKANINIVAPTLACIINLSLESATVSSDMKRALVTLLLKKTGLGAYDIKKTGLGAYDIKKTGLGAYDIKNYRPISKISFVSKLLERHVADDLRRYIDENKLLDPFQSACRPHHSTETAHDLIIERE